MSAVLVVHPELWKNKYRMSVETRKLSSFDRLANEQLEQSLHVSNNPERLLNLSFYMKLGRNIKEPSPFLYLMHLFFLQSPQAGTKDKTLCCWFCTSGPISLSAKIERKGYTPGKTELMISYAADNVVSQLFTRYLSPPTDS